MASCARWRSSHLLAEGVLYPRWAPDFYLGYATPSSTSTRRQRRLLAALAALTGLGVLRGMVAVQVIALLLYPTRRLPGGAVAVRHRCRGRWARSELVDATLSVYAPLRFRELFTQGNLSQFLALALLPWCAWLLMEAIRRVDLRWKPAAGVALAGLVYAHHPPSVPRLSLPRHLRPALWRSSQGAATGPRHALLAAEFAVSRRRLPARHLAQRAVLAALGRRIALRERHGH